MSLSNRVDLKDDHSVVMVRPNPDHPDLKLLYRYIKLTDSAVSVTKFLIGEYNTAFPIKKGEVLELMEEGEAPVLYTVDHWNPSFTVFVKSKKDMTELKLSTNPGISISRILIEDPQKRLYYLGTKGTLDEREIWYLPPDIVFSKNKENASWHIRLDRYSSCNYDYVIQ